MGIAFEWDEKKRHHNLEKHGLDFTDVRILFTSGRLRVRRRVVNLEVREEGYGFFFQRLTYMVYVWRGSTIRLISWRKANGREKEAYQAQTEDWERFKQV